MKKELMKVFVIDPEKGVAQAQEIDNSKGDLGAVSQIIGTLPSPVCYRIKGERFVFLFDIDSLSNDFLLTSIISSEGEEARGPVVICQEGPNSKGELDYIGLDDEDVETIKQSLAPVYADDHVVYMVSVDDDY